MKSVATLASRAVGAAATGPAADDLRLANLVFKMLHGFYGSLFLSRFATGMVSGEGEDRGVVSARKVWAASLRVFDGRTIEQAVERCKERHTEFPPTLPQFLALCRACQPRESAVARGSAIEMSQELRSHYAASARAINEKHSERATRRHPTRSAEADGISGLLAAIADAVGCAGGDEVATLRRLEVHAFARNTTNGSRGVAT